MADLLQHEQHHDPTNVGIVSVPHGPETGDDHVQYPAVHNAENERAIFAYLLRPDDSYTADGVYWADLPLGKRFSFISSVDNAEAAKELGQLGRMIKKDPLSPIGWYFRNAILPGAGLGLEGYVPLIFILTSSGRRGDHRMLELRDGAVFTPSRRAPYIGRERQWQHPTMGAIKDCPSIALSIALNSLLLPRATR